ncbi:hypothetical protein [Archaeoglobus profundus]|uniref:Tubulin/FtsZ GTPase n=1 Tax=Archaeoglobus profundus (strain DSM 5631 / JCM 9629 / NBRC 100127 / Av18) TaxID=572546 RepID=D2RFC5_ARCPA|nr:hypothetical protein [Archaeoglobus profundus]ADB58819.1 hypothetical protein Arcpr_1775 [Archaeoglobus profundus DSM 5631]
MRVAVVGFGGAGQEIVKAFADRFDGDVYVVSDIRNYDLPFFDFSEFERLISTLSSYDSVILVAGLGARGGEYLVEATRLLKNVAAIFVVCPLRVEKARVARAERQLSRLRGQVFVRRLDDYFERIPGNKSVAEALREFDEEIAKEIAIILKGLGL